MPGARAIVALRDPRTLLLNWWVYGSAQGFAFPGAEIAAEWLAHALTPIADRLESAPGSMLPVRGEAVDEDAAAVCAELAERLGLAATPSAERLAALGAGQGGHPNSFAAGHWRHYRDALSSAFDKLEGIAQRLGY